MVTEDPLADEAAMLAASLDLQRAILRWKAADLDAAGMRATLGPSSLTLAGLVKHMAMVEEWWFTVVFAGGEHSPDYANVDWDADPDWEFTSALDEDPADLLAAFDRSCRSSRAVVAAASSLDDRAARSSHARGELSLRWIMVHMIEEYARHNGHADLLREAADGATGSMPPGHPLHDG